MARSKTNAEIESKDLLIRYRPVAELIPYARNSRTHSDAQVAQIAASIREFGWTNPILTLQTSSFAGGSVQQEA